MVVWSTFLKPVVKTGVLVLGFLAGSFGYRLLADWPVMHQLAHLPVAVWQTWYAKIGVVLWGLAPLTAYLFVLAVVILLGQLRLMWVPLSPVKHLGLIVESGPMLGVLGTMIGLSQVMINIDLSSGLQVAIRQMTVLMGQALNSSIYGIVLALAAFFLRYLASDDEEW